MVKKGNIPWNKGKTNIYSTETKKKISESVKQRWKDIDYRNRQSKSKSNSEIYKTKHIKQSVTMKKLWKNNPNMKKESSIRLKQLFNNSPDIIEKMSSAKKKNWQDKDYVKNQMNSRKNSIDYQNRKYQQAKTLKDTYDKNPEIKKQISETLKKLYKSNPEMIINARKAGLKSRKNQKSPSSIEIKMASELNRNNIYYSQQVIMLDKYRVDFLIEDFLVIEVDGSYWHNLPNIIEKDIKRDKELTENGFTVLRFWEHEINEDVSKCVDKIKTYIS